MEEEVEGAQELEGMKDVRRTRPSASTEQGSRMPRDCSSKSKQACSDTGPLHIIIASA